MHGPKLATSQFLLPARPKPNCYVEARQGRLVPTLRHQGSALPMPATLAALVLFCLIALTWAPHVRYFAMSYFLGRGGISDASTGSNSNFGSSASGAKLALVVFIQFLSLRSGKSGL